MATTQQPQQPPDERVYRSLEVIQDPSTRIAAGTRLAKINRDLRALDAKKKALVAELESEKKKLDEERVSLEAVPLYADGSRLEILSPCIGRPNLTTGQYDIYRIDSDATGKETLSFVKSEPMPSKYAYLLQPELPFDKDKDKDGKDAKDKDKKDDGSSAGDKPDASNGKGRKGRDKGGDAPPAFPDA
ncbi:hypothetical protein EKK58_05860 [Candidatus Dependentiae bacterium]|nr:MAG: hypothetical protein EKK58_05860 [Candidatus Dependentiae bacterium]